MKLDRLRKMGEPYNIKYTYFVPDFTGFDFPSELKRFF